MFSLNGTGYNFSGWKTNSGQNTHSINSNPLFTNGTGVYSLATDFSLQAGSPAIWGRGECRADYRLYRESGA